MLHSTEQVPSFVFFYFIYVLNKKGPTYVMIASSQLSKSTPERHLRDMRYGNAHLNKKFILSIYFYGVLSLKQKIQTLRKAI